MQIVIDIPEYVYDTIVASDGYIQDCDNEKVGMAVKDGTPLPKGHGDLIDRNKIEYLKAIHDLKWGKITSNECATKIRCSAPTIIEADTESEG